MHITCLLEEEFGDYGRIVISVADTGVGISQENIKRLFKVFGFLEQTESMNTKGIGLGLYISKKITNIFGGDIEVESELGRGTKFTYWFSLDKPNDEQLMVTRHMHPTMLGNKNQIHIQVLPPLINKETSFQEEQNSSIISLTPDGV